MEERVLFNFVGTRGVYGAIIESWNSKKGKFNVKKIYIRIYTKHLERPYNTIFERKIIIVDNEEIDIESSDILCPTDNEVPLIDIVMRRFKNRDEDIPNIRFM